jgi:ABC-type sugar transport system substrate-binding protein
MKKAKKVISMLLSLSLLLCGLSGCGGTETPAASAASGDEGQPYRLGVLSLGSLTTAFKSATLSLQDMCDTANVELVQVELAGYDDQGFLTTYENMINMGVDGVIAYTFSEGTIRLLADLFEENDVEWFLANRQISDPDLKEYVYSQSSFVGNCYCDEQQIAYNMVKQLNEDYGVTNLAVIGLTQGDLNGDLRDKGIAAACEEMGVTLLTETRGISTVDDVTKAVDSIVSSYPEVDGIFIVGGTITAGALAGANQSLANHGLSDKVAIGMIDIAAGMSAYMGDNGPLKVVAGGNLVMDYIFAGACMINQSNGVNADQVPYVVNTNMMYVYTPEDAADYDLYCENTERPLMSGDKWYDTLLGKDLASIQAFSDGFSIADAKALNQ